MWVRRQWRGSIGFTRRGSAGGRRCRGVQTGYGDSPYQSLSSFAGNPLLISPDWLIEDGLLRARVCTEEMLAASAFQSLRDLTHASARSGGQQTPRTDASMTAAS